MTMHSSDRPSWAEPYKIKSVELIRMTTREEREHFIKDAWYNLFTLHSDDVLIDRAWIHHTGGNTGLHGDFSQFQCG